ncbi:MAG: dUTP diphosphatase [Parachlamydiaceae bacterium]|nr:dUTP diphosphatase [Parachlamydiaceae bacterium]
MQQKIDIAVLAEEDVQIPVYASSGASGADVKAYILQDIIIAPGASRLIPTGLHFQIPLGYEIQVRPRSGLALKNQISVLNTPGTIDADYRGEVGIILINHSTQNFTVTPGMRIAQIVVCPVFQANFVSAAELAETKRGVGGFGHTGLN